MITKPEIMAPAGDHTCLQAALSAGADAVYLGIQGLNMRAKARNFEWSQLPGVVATCHERGVKVYLTLNTIVHEGQLDDVRRQVGVASEAGVDAVIGWDFAVVEEASRRGLPVFASTQMSVSNSQSLLRLHRMLGIDRFVLARECTLEEVIAIREALRRELGAAAGRIELEVFAHGAMCLAISGRCLLSEFQSGASGSHGECLQPCRRLYEIRDVEEGDRFVLGRDFVLSPKDVCTLPFIDQLLDAGVNSLKIEGRNRNAEYVDVVTRVYREAVDAWWELRDEPERAARLAPLKAAWVARVETVYQRGFSEGFFMGRRTRDWTTAPGNQATLTKRYIGRVVNYYRRVGAAEIELHQHALAIGDRVLLRGPTTGVVWQTVQSLQIDRTPVERAERGARVALKLDMPVRPGDEVFRVDPREEVPATGRDAWEQQRREEVADVR